MPGQHPGHPADEGRRDRRLRNHRRDASLFHPESDPLRAVAQAAAQPARPGRGSLRDHRSGKTGGQRLRQAGRSR